MTFLWVGAAMTIASSIGAIVFPVVIGHLMLHNVCFLAYLLVGKPRSMKISQRQFKVHSEEMVKFNPSI